jgi:REP element-mobilizing transposase RayT
MPNYRRARVPGGTFFLTIVTHDRAPIFREQDNFEKLRRSLRLVKTESPFEMEAAVVLPDHVHLIWSLPGGDQDFSRRVGRMNSFQHRLLRPGPSQQAGANPLVRGGDHPRRDPVRGWRARLGRPVANQAPSTGPGRQARARVHDRPRRHREGRQRAESPALPGRSARRPETHYQAIERFPHGWRIQASVGSAVRTSGA